MFGKYPELIKICEYEEHRGLGYALQKGILECEYEYIARMDSDDVARKERFEKQINYLEQHLDIDILGGYLQEYDETLKKERSIRKVPITNEEIYKNIGRQSPFNHSTVIFKKAAVLKAGNYREEAIEDYKLWIRMCLQNCRMENLPEIFINYRTSKEMYLRRSGICYFFKMKEIEKSLLKHRFISRYQYMKNNIIRMIVAISPIKIKQIIYPHIIRKYSF